MSLNFAINNASTGLGAASRQAEITANNIANANTEGYDKRAVRLQSVAVDGRGAGVRVASVDRVEARAITADRRRAEAEYGEQSALTDGAKKLADLVGGPDDTISLFSRFDSLETALRDLADAPESALTQSGAIQAATDLASFFNTLESNLQAFRQDVDQEIANQVATLNAVIMDIDALNEDIAKGANVGRDTTEFEAQRDALIDRVSEIVPIETLPQDDGRVFLATTTGAMLLTGTAAQFEFTAAPIVTASMDLRGGAPGSLSGLTLNGGDITPDDTGVQTLATGSLRGLFEVRDKLTVDFQDQIDALAGDLIARFNAAEPTGTIPAGQAGLFTDNQLDDSGVRGLAGRLQVNDLVLPGTGSIDGLLQGIYVVGTPEIGDNTQEIALLEAMTTVQAAPTAVGVNGAHDASGLAAEFGSLNAVGALRAEERLSARSGQVGALEQAEVSATGVDIDEELQNLTLIQTAYAANARVLQAVDEMLRTLLEI